MTNQNRKSRKALIREVMDARGINYTTAKRAVADCEASLDHDDPDHALLRAALNLPVRLDEVHSLRPSSAGQQRVSDYLRRNRQSRNGVAQRGDTVPGSLTFWPQRVSDLGSTGRGATEEVAPVVVLEDAPGVLRLRGPGEYPEVEGDLEADVRALPGQYRAAATRLATNVEDEDCSRCGRGVGLMLVGEADERIEWALTVLAPSPVGSGAVDQLCEACAAPLGYLADQE